MPAILKSQFSTSLINSLFKEIITKSARYYYTFGKHTAWNLTDTVENPENSISYENRIRRNFITAKSVKSSDISFVVPRIFWTAGVVYDDYDDSYSPTNKAFSGAESLTEAKYYVMTDRYNIYKCINNNNNAVSTVKPTLVITDIFTTADGYIWKFMGTIPVSLRNKFATSAYIPVTTAITSTFYTSGMIDSINIDNPGTGYATAPTLAVTGDGYLAENPYNITSITILDGGSGYTVAPTITISAPIVGLGSDIQATATTAITSNSVSSVTITNPGFGYDNTVSLTVTEPLVGTQFVVSTSYTNGQILKNEGRFYEVVGTGLSGTILPVHTSGTVVSGAISLLFVGQTAKLQINATKTEAIITATVTSGSITGINIVNGGIGYTFGTIAITGGGGTGAELSINLSNAAINTLQGNVELLAKNGSIDRIKVVTGGTNYSNATVTITGDGTGATATANIVNGIVTKINMVDRGLNYSYINVAISGDGTGATARGILSPQGGHGKNAVNELNASSLMLYSIVENDKFSGIRIFNDYRQITILKNPVKVTNQAPVILNTATFCYRLKFGTTVNLPALVTVDMVLTGQGGKSFTVVGIEGQFLIVHSVNNNIPVIFEQLITPTNDILTPIEVLEPSINKFSGEMLYVDNRDAFVYSTDQIISVRTIITI